MTLYYYSPVAENIMKFYQMRSILTFLAVFLKIAIIGSIGELMSKVSTSLSDKILSVYCEDSNKQFVLTMH